MVGRSKQNYYIVRRGDPWCVRRLSDDAYVCDWPPYCYCDLPRRACMAETDEEARAVAKEAEEFMQAQKDWL